MSKPSKADPSRARLAAQLRRVTAENKILRERLARFERWAISVEATAAQLYRITARAPLS